MAFASNVTAAALLRFDRTDGYTPPRLRIAWLENTLDCRTWTYYCDLKDAMARLHDLCVPRGSNTCVNGRRGFSPDLVVAGPRYMANVAHSDETLGFDRERYAHLPLAVIQNKMYAASTREIVGDASAKLRWARAAGAVVGFTWLPTQHVEFTSLSGIPHHRLPFGVDTALYGKHAAERAQGGPATYMFDVGFTGASSHKYPLRQAIIGLIRSLNIRSYLGTWQQTALKTTHNNSWKALDRDGYVKQISLTKMWVSTTGPSNIVGTRYFEIIGSGTTLLLCNKAPSGVYDGLLQDGVHAVVFDGMDDLRAKILYYTTHETARRAIVDAAFALTQKIHTWDVRARFVTMAIMSAIANSNHKAAQPFYVRPSSVRVGLEPYLACLDARHSLSAFTEVVARRPLRRYTVETCATACRRRSTHFAVQCGGFCSGNGHRLARCFCAKLPFVGTTIGKRRQKVECSTACSLHDPRPCGGWDAVAVYSMRRENATATAPFPANLGAPRAFEVDDSRRVPPGALLSRPGTRGRSRSQRGAGGRGGLAGRHTHEQQRHAGRGRNARLAQPKS
jgi:hypothetical protein